MTDEQKRKEITDALNEFWLPECFTEVHWNTEGMTTGRACLSCGASADTTDQIQHKDGCSTAKIIQLMSELYPEE